MFARTFTAARALAQVRSSAAGSSARLFYTTEAAPATPQLLLRLKADVKDAMRAKDKERLAVVKGILSDLTYLEKSPQAPAQVNDSVIQVLIQKSIKRREESILNYKNAGRPEQAAQEQKEIEMLTVYLPSAMTEQEIEEEVRKVIKEQGATGPKDMGKVMKELGGLDPARAPKKTLALIKLAFSISSFSTINKNKGNKVILKRLKSLRRSNVSLVEETGSIPNIDPDQLTRTNEEERAPGMQLGEPSLWEVRRLSLDLGMIPRLEHPIPFRKSHLYDMCTIYISSTRSVNGIGHFTREVMYVEPLSITNFHVCNWFHPDMLIKFDAEHKYVMIAKMYRIICSTPEIVAEFQRYHACLMKLARIPPDNTSLYMGYRSQPLRIAKEIERTAGVNSPVNTKVLEAGRKYTELGECSAEFHRMSNASDALSVGFCNPATKHDMAIGVMVFDKSKVKATVSSLGLNVLNALGPSPQWCHAMADR
ncbi:hypothetical protein BGX20_011257 [Mortierella sp. AD010]|nr:hypothetical protein BGX20_011257 [Mortierella sp. AD010]